MKKLMILAAVAAMASGAQATYNYSFGLTTTGVPTSLVSLDNPNTYLTVKYKGETVVYCSIDDIAKLHQNSGTTIAVGNYTLHNQDTAVVNINDDGSTKKVEFSVGFTGPDTLFEDYNPNGQNMVGGVDEENWSIVLNGYANMKGGGQEAIYMTATGASFSGNQGSIGFSNSVTYSAVPEPTSAMLLLLGFAGLALKRKQVA